MIFVIGPLVKGTNSRHGILKYAAYVGAMMVSASLVGAVVSLTGHFLFRQLPIAWLALAVGTIVFGARELGLLRLPLPQSSWQVPRSWMRSGAVSSPLLYGAAIGIGFLTRAPYSSFHAMLGWQLVLGSVGVGAAMGVSYSVARATAPLVAGLLASDPTVDLIRSTRWVAEKESVWHLLNGLILALVGGVLVVVALA